MAGILDSQTFILIWVGFLLLMSCGIGLFFLWGIRNGQFQDQERARYLAIQSGIPSAEELLGVQQTERERTVASQALSSADMTDSTGATEDAAVPGNFSATGADGRDYQENSSFGDAGESDSNSEDTGSDP